MGADLKRMFELGFEFTHITEFAWARIEPEEGKFDFSWLYKSVEFDAHFVFNQTCCVPVFRLHNLITNKYD